MYVMLRAAKAAMVLGMMLAVWVVTVATAGASTSRVAAAGTVSSRWNQTNYNAVQSRANVTEQTLTRATASKIRHLRSVTAPPISGNGCCSPGELGEFARATP